MLRSDAAAVAGIRVIGVDYDRTLTDERLDPHPDALDALTRARKRGLRVVVISGRDAPFLERELSHVADLFVAENGCLIGAPGETPRPTGACDLGYRARLERLDGIEFEHGQVLSSFDTTHYDAVAAAVRGAPVDLVRNRDRTMILPRGTDKALGMRAALDRLDVPPEAAAAAGDGENDLPLLRSVGYGIAVSNAVDELKRAAHHVTRGYGGAGVAEWVREVWLPFREVSP